MRLIGENSRSALGRVVNTAVLTLATIFLSSSASNAWVTVSSPRNDSVVSGIVTVKASVTSDYWSQLVVDGKAVASAAAGNVSFTWNTTTVGDGAHWATVKGYQKGSHTADSNQAIAVSVLNHVATDHSIRFGTLPESAPLRSGSGTGRSLRSEMVPNNTRTTRCQPRPSSILRRQRLNCSDGKWAYARQAVHRNHRYDLRWAACKWGIDDSGSCAD